MYNEAISYYPHRFFHNPFLYKNVHKIHHRYGSPTLYSTTAMHPLEFLMYQTFLAIPAFTVPLHVGKLVASLYLLPYSNFCCLLLIFPNSLNQDQDRQTVCSDLIKTIRHSDSVPERYFLKRLILKKSADANKSMKIYPVCKVRRYDVNT